MTSGKPRVCKDCVAEGVKTKRPAPHPGPRCSTHHREVRGSRREAAWARHILKTYGITPEEYYAIYEAQGRACYICQRAKGNAKRLSVDHDHVSGAVRGLLCKPCNRDVLGHLRDSIEALQRAIDYLTNPPARRVLGVRVVPEAERQ